MTVDSGIDRLLKDVLALQDEDGRGAELTEERVRHVLLGRGTFTADERSLLATSPLARLTYAEIAEDLRLEREAFEQGWHEEQFLSAVYADMPGNALRLCVPSVLTLGPLGCSARVRPQPLERRTARLAAAR